MSEENSVNKGGSVSRLGYGNDVSATNRNRNSKRRGRRWLSREDKERRGDLGLRQVAIPVTGGTGVDSPT